MDDVRTTRKKSVRTKAHKLINTAEANIRAVEKGMFGVVDYDMVYQYPFSGLGLGARILGEVKKEYTDILR